MSDQAFPEHYLIQAPIPDRTTALELGGGFRNAPLSAMADAMSQFSVAGVSTVAIACNTAHAWHAQLQEQFPELHILHVAREVARLLQHLEIQSVGLLATNGTYAAGIYEVALAEVDVTCHTPTVDEREVLMKGIYEGVKRGNMLLAQSHFRAVAQAVLQRTGVTALILGCTEIPLALKEGTFGPSIKLIDPANLLAQTLARHAYGLVGAPAATEDRLLNSIEI